MEGKKRLERFFGRFSQKISDRVSIENSFDIDFLQFVNFLR